MGAGLWALAGGGVLVLAVLAIWWFWSASPEDLIDKPTLSPAEIRALAIGCLLHEDMNVRVRASTKLASLGASAVPVLKDLALTYSNPRLRAAVLDVLKAIDVEASAQVVEKMMTDSDAAVRQRAVEAAAGMTDPRVSAALQQTVTDPDTVVRSRAVQALSNADPAVAVPALESFLKDSNPEVRWHAARRLKTMTGRDYDPGMPKR